MVGVTAQQWFALLQENHFRIDVEYWHRAMAISLAAPFNSFFAARENKKHGKAIQATSLTQDPIFILGHWRSGTTHLHYLMCEDPQFCAPNNYQASRPDIFLNGGEKSLATKIANALGLIPKTRPMDEVKVDVDTVAEDEQGLFMHCGLSPIGAWLFPQNRHYYDKYLDFSNASDTEKTTWKEGFHWFNQKISYRYPGKQLLLKSPPHTARIPLILELYPNAKFIHIQRHPFDVYRSFFYFYQKLVTMINLQRLSVEQVEETIISRYQLIYNSYFAHRRLIPENHLVEIYYEDLETHPLEQLRFIYESLQLSDFIAIQPKLSDYLQTVNTYKKNPSTSLPQDLRDKLYNRWRLCFDNWRYEP